VAVYSGPLIFGKAVGNAVQLADDISHDIAVLVAAVGGNPALVTRIRGMGESFSAGLWDTPSP
jgi:hypothetical protein